MNNISLTMSNGVNTTVISNRFIDEYMPKASGSYVKVYIYLLRCMSDSSLNTSLSFIADRLDETEKDIMRALTYWEEAGVISIKRDSYHRVTDIVLLNLDHSKCKTELTSSHDVPVVPLYPMADSDLQEEPFYISEVYAYSTIPEQKPTYSDLQLSSLLGIDEIKELLSSLEQKLARLLKPADLQLIMYFYEGLGLSVPLILHLYDYCLSKNKKQNAYIEAVAVSWARDGINTVEQAMQSSVSHNSNYAAVCKAFGLNRTPAAAEQAFMDRWFHTFGFSVAIVKEACNKTILTINKPDFKYCDRILESWYKDGVSDIEEIRKADKVHAKMQTAARNNTTHKVVNTNRFNLFPQRNYSEDDYSSLEQHLLNNQQG